MAQLEITVRSKPTDSIMLGNRDSYCRPSLQDQGLTEGKRLKLLDGRQVLFRTAWGLFLDLQEPSRIRSLAHPEVFEYLNMLLLIMLPSMYG